MRWEKKTNHESKTTDIQNCFWNKSNLTPPFISKSGKRCLRFGFESQNLNICGRSIPCSYRDNEHKFNTNHENPHPCSWKTSRFPKGKASNALFMASTNFSKESVARMPRYTGATPLSLGISGSLPFLHSNCSTQWNSMHFSAYLFRSENMVSSSFFHHPGFETARCSWIYPSEGP